MIAFRVCLLLTSLSAFAMAPDAALKRLVEGNQRYIKDALSHPYGSSLRREETAAKQNPFAVILGCADSRVPPEIIFDEGIGDLFTVRVAGNVAGPVELDSIEYAAKYLGSNLILVLGHQSCGAVTAVVQGNTGDIEAVADLIQPAVDGVEGVEEAIKANVRWIVDDLKKAPLLKGLIASKKVAVRGAYYHLGSGEVELLD